MGHDALGAHFHVPHTTVGQEDCAVDRYRPATGRQRLDGRHQLTPQTADLGQQRSQHGFQDLARLKTNDVQRDTAVSFALLLAEYLRRLP